MLKPIHAVLTATATLAGCAMLGAQFRAASEPESGERARVRVIAAQQVRATPGKACADVAAPGNGVVIGAALGSHGYAGRTLGMPAGGPMPANGSAAEMFVTAGQPITFSFIYTPGDPYRCGIGGISFVPEANKDYEVAASYDRDRGVCGVATRSLTDPQLRVIQTAATRCGAQH